MSEDAPTPGMVWMYCPECGEWFGASPHAIAEGRDTCANCKLRNPPRKAKNHTSTVPRIRFQKLYTFYLAFWEWWKTRDDRTAHQLFLAHTYFNASPRTVILGHDAIIIELQEWHMLNVLKDRWIEWIHTETTRSFNRMYYAFYQLDWYYKGNSKEKDDDGE